MPPGHSGLAEACKRCGLGDRTTSGGASSGFWRAWSTASWAASRWSRSPTHSKWSCAVSLDVSHLCSTRWTVTPARPPPVPRRRAAFRATALFDLSASSKYRTCQFCRLESSSYNESFYVYICYSACPCYFVIEELVYGRCCPCIKLSSWESQL